MQTWKRQSIWHKIIRSFCILDIGGVMGGVIERSNFSRKLQHMSGVYDQCRSWSSWPMRCTGSALLQSILRTVHVLICYTWTAGCSFREKNDSGCAASLTICCRSAPTTTVEASVRRTRMALLSSIGFFLFRIRFFRIPILSLDRYRRFLLSWAKTTRVHRQTFSFIK